MLIQKFIWFFWSHDQFHQVNQLLETWNIQFPQNKTQRKAGQKSWWSFGKIEIKCLKVVIFFIRIRVKNILPSALHMWKLPLNQIFNKFIYFHSIKPVKLDVYFQNTTVSEGNSTYISTSISDHPDLHWYATIYGSSIGVMLLFTSLRAFFFMKVRIL